MGLGPSTAAVQQSLTHLLRPPVARCSASVSPNLCTVSQGNLTFGVDGDVTLIENSKVVAVIGDLLATKEENVEKAMLYRTVATGRDIIDKQHTAQEAGYGRDALAKVANAVSSAVFYS